MVIRNNNNFRTLKKQNFRTLITFIKYFVIINSMKKQNIIGSRLKYSGD